MLKKGKFGWNEEADTTFLVLKQTITTISMLAMPNFNDSFTIKTDAFWDRIDTVLSQQGKLIVFMSRALGVTKKILVYLRQGDADHCKGLTLMASLSPRKNILHSLTNQCSLKYFLQQCMGTLEQQMWVVKLLGYDYEILYHSGCENSAADALSCRSGSPVLHHLHMLTVTVWDEIQKAYVRNFYVQSLTCLAKDQQARPYVWRKGLLFFKERVVIPSQAALQAQLLHEMHDTIIGGHSRVFQTFKKLAQQFYWPKMY